MNLIQAVSPANVYRFDPPKAPELSGIAYSILTNVAELPLIGDFLMSKIKFDSKIPLIRKFANERPHTVPTVMPLVASSEEEHKLAKRYAETFNIHHLVKTERKMKRSEDPKDFKYWTIEDYAVAYSKKKVTPVDVAKSAIWAIRTSESMEVRVNFTLTWSTNGLRAHSPR